MSMTGFLFVGIGAAIGAWLRWCLSVSFNAILPTLPLGTLFANLAGGYLMGIAMGLFAIKTNLSPEMKLLATTGFLGGLTTFSTFSAESVTLFTKGQLAWGVAHLVSHVFGSLLMTGLGLVTVTMLKP